MSKKVKQLTKYYYAQTKPAQNNCQYIQVEYQVDKIIDHRIKRNYRLNYIFDPNYFDDRPLIDIPNHQLEFLIRWKGYGSEDQSWEPGEHLKNAPMLLQQYKSHFKHSMSSKRTTTYVGRPRGRKAKVREVFPKTQEKTTRNGRGLKFNRIYEQNGAGVKQHEEDSDGLQIIDQAAYIQGTKEDHPKVYNSKMNILPIVEKKMDQEEQPDLNFVSSRNESDNALQNQDDRFKVTFKHGSMMNHDFMDSMPENYCNFAESIIEQVSHSFSSILSKQKIHVLDLQQIKHRVMQEQKESNMEIDCPPTQQNNIIQTTENKLSQKRKQFDIRQFNLDAIQLTPQQPNSQKYIEEQAISKKPVLNQHLSHKEQQQNQEQMHFKRRHQFQLLPHQEQKIQKKIKTSNSQNPMPCQTKIIVEPIQNMQQSMRNDEDQQNLNSQPIKQVHKFSFLYSQINNFEPINLDSSNSVGHSINKTTLKQKIEAQLKSLLQQQPINLSDDSAQQPANSIPQQQVISKQSCEKKQSFCEECKKYKQSEQLLSDYFKYYIDQMDEETTNLSFDKIYQQQQTFILVNGLNPHHQMDQSDRVKKLTVLEGQINLQAIICKNEATRDQIHQILKDYKLAKIVQAKGQWYGVFKTNKLIFGKKHYYYIKMRYFANQHKTLIAQFLTNHE